MCAAQPIYGVLCVPDDSGQVPVSWQWQCTTFVCTSLQLDVCCADHACHCAGARTLPGAALSSVSDAKQALDVLLLQRQRQAVACRCVVHACVSPMPLAAPLSFPRTLLPAPAATSTQGAAVDAGASAAPHPYLPKSAKAPSIPAPGAFSRLTATSGFEPVLQGAARDLQRFGAYAAGRAALEEWGYSASDIQELRENLLDMAGKYTVEFD